MQFDLTDAVQHYGDDIERASWWIEPAGKGEALKPRGIAHAALRELPRALSRDGERRGT